jgi:hypothetical protein
MLRKAGAVTGILLASLLLSACAQTVGGTPVPSAGLIGPRATTHAPAPAAKRPPHILVFSVTGTSAAITSVTYGYDGHDTTGPAAALPWRATVNIPNDGARHTYEFTINTSGNGNVQAEGLLDGSVIGSSSGTGGTTISLNGDFAG